MYILYYFSCFCDCDTHMLIVFYFKIGWAKNVREKIHDYTKQTKVMNILLNMYSSFTEHDYIKLYKDLEVETKNSQNFKRYFDTNYHNIRDNWTCKERKGSIIIYNTNNCCETVIKNLQTYLGNKKRNVDEFLKTIRGFLNNAALSINVKGLILILNIVCLDSYIIF